MDHWISGSSVQRNLIENATIFTPKNCKMSSANVDHFVSASVYYLKLLRCPCVCGVLQDFDLKDKATHRPLDKLKLHLDIGPLDFQPLPAAAVGHRTARCCICSSVNHKNYLDVENLSQALPPEENQKDVTTCRAKSRDVTKELTKENSFLQEENLRMSQKQESRRRGLTQRLTSQNASVKYSAMPSVVSNCDEEPHPVDSYHKQVASSQSGSTKPSYSASDKTNPSERPQTTRSLHKKSSDGTKGGSKYKPAIEFVATPSRKNGLNNTSVSCDSKSSSLQTKIQPMTTKSYDTNQSCSKPAKPLGNIFNRHSSLGSGNREGKEISAQTLPQNERSAIVKPIVKGYESRHYYQRREDERGDDVVDQPVPSTSNDQLTSCPLCTMVFDKRYVKAFNTLLPDQ